MTNVITSYCTVCNWQLRQLLLTEYDIDANNLAESALVTCRKLNECGRNWTDRLYKTLEL